MNRKIITTGDGSKTIHIEEWNEQYHSTHGAINEAKHVYIKHALLFYVEQFVSKPLKKPISILEIGFGTGLNAFLTLIEAKKQNLQITYTGVEAFPVLNEEIEALNYVELISKKHKKEFQKIHAYSWDEIVEITENFNLKKEKKFFKEISNISEFDIIYFDAFGPRTQPELWTQDIFELLFKASKSNAVLTTYSSMGSAKRAMKTVGFEVERLEGPPNKRHMLRAVKR